MNTCKVWERGLGEERGILAWNCENRMKFERKRT
jgi:hypothetical protein